jgi:catechol 2,3-dioxygenase-like lactoylglutathione lyase family enzyme
MEVKALANTAHSAAKDTSESVAENPGHTPSVTGLNHVTLAVSDLQRSFDFYVSLLGMKPHVRWARGAYLSTGNLWFCLSTDQASPAQDYTHVALSVDAAELPQWRRRFSEAQVPLWKENTSEGDSLYFLDPDGHQLELHAGDLNSRLRSLRLKPYDDLQWFE